MRERLGHWLATLGPLGIFLVSLLDSAFIPMPQGVDALVIAQAIAMPSMAYPGAAGAVIGSLLGCLVLYSIARRGGRAVLEKKASSQGIEKMQRQVERYGAFVLILPTMIPLPLPTKLFVIAAGVFQMRLVPFVVAIAFARVVRYFGEAYLARRYGDHTTEFLKQNALTGILIALALVALFWVVNRWSSRKVSEGS